ncbi:hypothetical protein [Niallia taxi]|uniref:hypothetical protein n=1 Tax=Niallia taxi TaxID=2499688 RepID=UPI002551507C|nr:hypothetical protein [Niallia taxi]MDK8641342.1 hypothetical protein [Niallia taxi]
MSNNLVQFDDFIDETVVQNRNSSFSTSNQPDSIQQFYNTTYDIIDSNGKASNKEMARVADNNYVTQNDLKRLEEINDLKLTNLKTEIHGDIKNLKTNMDGNFSVLEAKLEGKFNNIDEKFRNLDTKLEKIIEQNEKATKERKETIKWTIGTSIALVGIIFTYFRFFA